MYRLVNYQEKKRTFGIIEIRNITLPENSISNRMIAITHNVRSARSGRKCSLRHFSFNPFVITSAVKLVEMFNRSKVKSNKSFFREGFLV